MDERVRWTPDFSVGVREFDEHHRTMLDMINRLLKARGSNQEPAVVGEIMDQLVKYTHFHFAAEEVLLEETNYPELDLHRDEHEDFIQQITALQGKFDAGVELSGEDLLEILARWLLDHILGMDKRYTSHLHRHGRD